jgi:hypothetical protein
VSLACHLYRFNRDGQNDETINLRQNRLLNLSFGELMSSAADVSEGAYLTKGGWPELNARSDIDPHFWYAAYLSTYLRGMYATS